MVSSRRPKGGRISGTPTLMYSRFFALNDNLCQQVYSSHKKTLVKNIHAYRNTHQFFTNVYYN